MKLSFKVLIFISLLCFIVSCQTGEKNKDKQTYLRFVGDIESDSILDNPKFKTCNGDEHAFQYFNTGKGLRYKGEKTALVSTIQNSYKPVKSVKNQSGYIRLRFIINCKGEAGRFRVLSSDFDYQDKEFDKAIVNQLLTIVRGLDGWEIMIRNEKSLDYYLYLIFKIENGRIIEILP
jgi:hypothetical protein